MAVKELLRIKKHLPLTARNPTGNSRTALRHCKSIEKAVELAQTQSDLIPEIVNPLRKNHLDDYDLKMI